MSDHANDLFEYLLRLGDDRLVLGHRVSEWCGHGPILEEDIALANTALDHVGQANLLLTLAGQAENNGRDADALAFHRDAIDYRNLLLVELPRGDFAFTIARQFFFSTFALLQAQALQQSTNPDLAGIAAKMAKEARYHVRHAGEWMLMLGDGTSESHLRLQAAVDDLWRFTGEMFMADRLDRAMAARKIGVDPSSLEGRWREQVMDVMRRAGVEPPEVKWMQRGGRQGRHTEHLGHMLAEMQVLQRQHPGAAW